jgi:hypothetical protein
LLRVHYPDRWTADALVHHAGLGRGRQRVTTIEAIGATPAGKRI